MSVRKKNIILLYISTSVNWGNNTSGTGATQVTYNPQTPQQYQEGREATRVYKGTEESIRNRAYNSQYTGPRSGRAGSFETGGKRNNKSKRHNKSKRNNKSKRHH